VKNRLCNAVELAHPEENAEVFLAVDASSTHVGSVLQQHARGQAARPQAFFLLSWSRRRHDIQLSTASC
jgi:hypothetical protein